MIDVRSAGGDSRVQVGEELFAARALVLPSFAEGVPVVIMEAMALRRPTISTFVAGIPELVRPGEDGWLVPAGDVEALVDPMPTCIHTSICELTPPGDGPPKRVLRFPDANE